MTVPSPGSLWLVRAKRRTGEDSGKDSRGRGATPARVLARIRSEPIQGTSNRVSNSSRGLGPNLIQLVSDTCVINGITNADNHTADDRIIELGFDPDLFTEQLSKSLGQFSLSCFRERAGGRDGSLDLSSDLVEQLDRGLANSGQRREAAAFHQNEQEV